VFIKQLYQLPVLIFKWLSIEHSACELLSNTPNEDDNTCLHNRELNRVWHDTSQRDSEWRDDWQSGSLVKQTQLSDHKTFTLANCGPRWTHSRWDKISVLLICSNGEMQMYQPQRTTLWNCVHWPNLPSVTTVKCIFHEHQIFAIWVKSRNWIHKNFWNCPSPRVYIHRISTLPWYDMQYSWYYVM